MTSPDAHQGKAPWPPLKHNRNVINDRKRQTISLADQFRYAGIVVQAALADWTHKDRQQLFIETQGCFSFEADGQLP